jgi:hypothetical protein
LACGLRGPIVGIAWAAEADSSRAHLGPLEGLCVLRVVPPG